MDTRHLGEKAVRDEAFEAIMRACKLEKTKKLETTHHRHD